MGPHEPNGPIVQDVGAIELDGPMRLLGLLSRGTRRNGPLTPIGPDGLMTEYGTIEPMSQLLRTDAAK